MELNIYFVIVTYNAEKWLSYCLKGLEGNQVIIVDNNSKDQTINSIKSFYEWVHLIESKVNLGFGKGNNL
ncbi:glycosyltransferase, partial [Schleiferiaceae bacterium]|nr:glycosyltransferase [Schleiferiaceae bacterium]